MAIPYMEACRIAIYLEEEAADQYKRNKNIGNTSSSSGHRVEEITEIEIGDEEDDE